MKHHPLDHVGVAVASIAAARPLYERIMGSPGSPTLELPDQGVNVAFFGQVELIEPRGPESPVARFVEREGPGLHHLAYRVPDIRAELRELEADGFVLVDREPRVGAHGRLIAFVHPRSTEGVLLELVETPDG